MKDRSDDHLNKTIVQESKRTLSVSHLIISIASIIIVSMIFVAVASDKLIVLFDAIKNGTFTKEFSTSYENGLNNGFPLKDSFIDINGLSHKLFFQREMNGVVLLQNGQEHMPMTMEGRSEEGIVANADSLKQLSDWLITKGNKFLWCQIPQKLDDADDQLPAGLEDYGNVVADAFLEKLAFREVKYLDLRQSIREDGIDRYSLFLSTEHHWKPEGGFYAFQKICDYLRIEFGEEIPRQVTDLNNYSVQRFKKSSLGYYGQRTGWVFGGLDDFDLIYPKWVTKQSSWAPHKELFREGSFYDAIFYTEYLDTPWRERGLYGTYIGGDWPLVVHHSETAPIDKTIMILIDSYGTIPESFLTTVYRNVVAIDLRWVLRNNIKKTAVELIEEYHPDIVIAMFNPNQIGNAESEQFQYGIQQ